MAVLWDHQLSVQQKEKKKKIIKMLEGNGELDVGWLFAAGMKAQSILTSSAVCDSLHLKTMLGAERARSRASQMVTAMSSCREEAGKAACHVLTRMLVLTPERRCVGAGMKDQCWRKCWPASFGSCDGFWLLKTNVKAVLDWILEADQLISSSLANMVPSNFLMH